MHLVSKSVNGSEYFYLVKKERQGKRVVTAKTVYVGNRQKLAELVELSATNAFPAEATVQEIGGSLALSQAAVDLGLETRCIVRYYACFRRSTTKNARPSLDGRTARPDRGTVERYEKRELTLAGPRQLVRWITHAALVFSRLERARLIDDESAGSRRSS